MVGFRITNEAEVREQLLTAIDERMDDMVDFMVGEMKDNLDRNGTTHTSDLRKSITANKKLLEKEVVITAPYAEAIEFGRLPGSMPPVEPIQEWARLKLGLSRKQANNAGWAISKSILKNGTKPQPFIRPAIDATTRRFNQ